ncbi:ParA family protein [Streptomyces sp. MRC013]|uniref:KGGVGR-motif variant AAA ATPase n=1 Tax=Streptomyces sp. MRC013 TaxID=2898276 RepID=UPI0020274C88|nr:AAA family ATPase [Streptomyces sp. MRC013]URM90898.1 ParA family protein [Streptomyces sp. MRC013]
MNVIGDQMEATSPLLPGNLLTWVDVDEHCAALAVMNRWPRWLREVSAWWDGIELTVASNVSDEDVLAWLDTAFGMGSVVGEPEGPVLVLDRPQAVGREGLPVRILRSEDFTPGFRPPRLVERRITEALSSPLPRPADDGFPGGVQVAAFHSFKGGVGRTIHAVAFADLLARRGRRVLLVDADLEAPGITWMHQAQGGACDIAYDDLLALLHSSTEGDRTKAVQIATGYLVNQETIRHKNDGRLVILPTSRRTRLGPPRVEPTQLLTPDRPRYFLTESLAELAAVADLDTVIIDLRAGASELSAPILLDPRVQRIFVTTLSSQSLEGTEQMIRQLGDKAVAITGRDPEPAVVVTQFRQDRHATEVTEARLQLSRALEAMRATSVAGAAESTSAGDTLEVDATVLTEPIFSPFHEELLALPQSWDEVVEVVRRQGIGELLAETLPLLSETDSVPGSVMVEGIEGRRSALHRRAQSLVFAERTGLDSGLGFLSTDPLRRLVGDNRTSLPVTVVVGAKGSGKTFTYARMCAAGSWRKFAAGADELVRIDAPIVPVLDPANMEFSSDGSSPQRLRDHIAGGRGAGVPEIRKVLLDALQDQDGREDVVHWRRAWLRCMAMSLTGSAVSHEDPERVLRERSLTQQALFVFDGLEDFFQELEGEAKRVALRALFIEVPDWLRAFRSRPFGVVIFVRSDLVRFAVRQNLGQFLDRYDPYALRWDSQEALRLALWVATTAKAVPQADGDLMDYSWERLVQALVPVWGVKMGRKNSREARSDRWVPAALGDFNDQVQARDVVRFIRDAAEFSRRDQDWPDRLLTPGAMRQALVKGSREKLDELRQENPVVGTLLTDVGRHADEVVMPFNAEDVGLDANAIAKLKEAGALDRDSDGLYRLPEIYRHALGFRTRGRVRVIRS